MNIAFKGKIYTYYYWKICDDCYISTALFTFINGQPRQEGEYVEYV